MHTFKSLELFHSIANLSILCVCTLFTNSRVWFTGMHIHCVEHTSLNHWYAHPPCGAHLSQPLVCTSTVWSTPLSATGMQIHRVEHTSLSHWVCTSTVWSTPLSTTGMHIHRVEHTSLSHWYAHPPCGAHLSQPLVCTSTVWSTPLSTTGMHAHPLLCMLPACNLGTRSAVSDTEFLSGPEMKQHQPDHFCGKCEGVMHRRQ